MANPMTPLTLEKKNNPQAAPVPGRGPMSSPGNGQPAQTGFSASAPYLDDGGDVEPDQDSDDQSQQNNQPQGGGYSQQNQQQAQDPSNALQTVMNTLNYGRQINGISQQSPSSDQPRASTNVEDDRDPTSVGQSDTAQPKVNNLGLPSSNVPGAQFSTQPGMVNPYPYNGAGKIVGQGQGYDEGGGVSAPETNPTVGADPSKKTIPMPRKGMGFDDGGDVQGDTGGDMPSPSASPSAATPPKIVGYLKGAQAMPQPQAQQMEQRVDPTGQMDPNMRRLLAVQAASQVGGQDAAWALMQNYRQKADAYTSFAKVAAQGTPQKPADMNAAAKAATQAQQYVPNGESMSFTPTQGGLSVATKKLAQRGSQKPATSGGAGSKGYDDGGDVTNDDPAGAFGTGPEQVPGGASFQDSGNADPTQQVEAETGGPGLTPEGIEQSKQPPRGPYNPGYKGMTPGDAVTIPANKVVDFFTKNDVDSALTGYDKLMNWAKGAYNGPQGVTPSKDDTAATAEDQAANDPFKNAAGGAPVQKATDQQATSKYALDQTGRTPLEGDVAVLPPNASKADIAKFNQTGLNRDTTPHAAGFDDNIAQRAQTLYPGDMTGRRNYLESQQSERQKQDAAVDVAKNQRYYGSAATAAARDYAADARAASTALATGAKINQQKAQQAIEAAKPIITQAAIAAGGDETDPKYQVAQKTLTDQLTQIQKQYGIQDGTALTRAVRAQIEQENQQGGAQSDNGGNSAPQVQPGGAQAGQLKPNATQIQQLRLNRKGLATQFDAKFGDGASQQY